MFEKVTPSHPDKICDRIAGAVVDLAYAKERNPHIAVECMIGHGRCYLIIETDTAISRDEIVQAVHRIAGDVHVYLDIVPQDPILAENQSVHVHCGDNGVFLGLPLSMEQMKLANLAAEIYSLYPYDGKYILDGDRLIICQSHADTHTLQELFPNAEVNPIGDWTGGPDVDTGAVNRKLGSDMGDAVTGGGLHGKDLSKADVSVNIYAFLKAQRTGEPVRLSCAIGDDTVDGRPYHEIVETARSYIAAIGGFEKFAEWGLY